MRYFGLGIVLLCIRLFKLGYWIFSSGLDFYPGLFLGANKFEKEKSIILLP